VVDKDANRMIEAVARRVVVCGAGAWASDVVAVDALAQACLEATRLKGKLQQLALRLPLCQVGALFQGGSIRHPLEELD
jgi:hypothetical protein